MKFKVPSKIAIAENGYIARTDGNISSVKRDVINKNAYEWTGYRKNLTWDIDKLSKVISDAFFLKKFIDEDRYASPTPSYRFMVAPDNGKKIDQTAQLVFHKDSETILFFYVPFLKLCEFIAAYCEAFPQDLPLVLSYNEFGSIARITEDTTIDDIIATMHMDPEETWEAVE